MCGIAGCYRQADGQRLTSVMTDRIEHRGPDAGGVWSSAGGPVSMHLGHRRLSIIDLSTAADQPLRKGNFTLVYNGELYNYRALRSELGRAGVAFATESDTEVVLEAWRHWGPAALAKFRGMFAFALADTSTGELILARDPLGIKPLLYMRRGDGIVFASELKALVAAFGHEMRIEPGAMVASMLYYWVPEQRCAIKGVHKLPAGSWARLHPGVAEPEVHHYWRVQDVAAEAAGQPGPDLSAVIEESVRAHLVADVPVSSFLSGGLDSSIVTVLAHKDADSVDAYTITFRPQDQKLEAMPDDAVYARKVARQFGIDLHEIEISPDIVQMLPRMVDILDEPVGDPAAINTLLMCEAARERGVKVMLSGMGADELFGGYRKHMACMMASRYRRLPAAVRAPAKVAVAALPVSLGDRGLRYPRWAKRFMTFAELPEEARFRRSYTLYDRDGLTALVGSDLAGSVAEVMGEHAAIYDDNALDDEVNRMCLADTRLFMSGLNLTYTDRASMAASVEVRVPFVDKVVAEAAFAVPGSDKIRGRVGKAALKDAAENWLPHEIVHRPKASFGAPLRAWVRGDLKELIGDVLVGGELTQLGLLNKDRVNRLIADERAGREDYAKQIWQLLSMELWYRQVRAAGVAALLLTDRLRDLMKQIAQNYKSGELAVLDVPAPTCRTGGVLVRSLYSLISTGTEMMKVSEASMSMVGMARARPDQVKKVLDQVQQQGMVATYKKVMNKLDSYTPLGYSLCGVVTEVGKGAEEFTAGDLVACAGNEQALHAEYNWVPVNLCAKVPDGVNPEHAAFATVASIAMHGVRRGEVQLGETSAVIGLGLIGQLVVRLLVAAGVQVVGLDPVPDRCRLAEKAGAAAAGSPDDLDAALAELAKITGGRGADHVFLSAGGSGNGPVEAAVRLARDRARVIDIGKMQLDLPWNAYYEKELDVRFSRSYGPGRYDTRYELEGVDYPAGYVRWTEKRNLESFLDLIARNQLEVGTLIDGVFPFADAASVYGDLKRGTLKAIGVLLEYPEPKAGDARPATRRVLEEPKKQAPLSVRKDGKKDRVAIGFVGAGNYATSMLLPHLAKLPAANLAHVATTRSLSAVNAQQKFGFTCASTDADSVFEDDSLDAIFIVTRHATHAKLVCRALETGKAVFVEKPLALTREEADAIAEAVSRTGNDRLMAGFNRRFAPLLTQMRESFGAGAALSSTRYLINAGPLAHDSWYLNEESEGSRFAGEGGHFIDTLSWWAGSPPAEVYAARGPHRGDVQATFRFANGAVGAIAYVTGGNVRFPKETIDATGEGRSARLDNFRSAVVWSGRGKSEAKARGGQDKGQRGEMAAFVEAVRTGAPMPIPIDSLLATTRATIAVGESMLSGRPEQV